MNDRKRNYCGELILGTCLLLLTLAAQRPAFAADLGATANLNSSSDNGLNANAQAGAGANLAGANVNILLGGSISADAKSSSGQEGSQVSEDAKAKIHESGEFGLNKGENGGVRGRKDAEANAQIETGSDGGTAPVPEPATLIALGTLLSIVGGISMTARRKAGTQA